ncbi:MAG: hypothetical protein J0J04_08335 [Microbacterium sp.]|uniref:hypothetical protein n=1 Tax=Microbacterium sp. TaxID=51671 RepID=UPI001AD53037|nr:hypothetical protein [Microbacterium sp.]MBN9214809.1 hypothetical protein [Microbacterium sp.]
MSDYESKKSFAEIPADLADEWDRILVRMRQADYHVRNSITLARSRNVLVSSSMPDKISLDTVLLGRLTTAIEFVCRWAENPYLPGMTWQAALLRGAIESGATALWVLADGDEERSAARLLSLALQDAKFAPDDARSRAHVKELEAAISELDITSRLVRIPRYGDIVAESSEHGRDDRFQWSIAAGASHGQPWALDRLVRFTDAETGPLPVADIDAMRPIIDTAVRLTECAVSGFFAASGYGTPLFAYPNYWTLRADVISLDGAGDTNVDARAHDAHQESLRWFEAYRASADPSFQHGVIFFGGL